MFAVVLMKLLFEAFNFLSEIHQFKEKKRVAVPEEVVNHFRNGLLADVTPEFGG